MKPDCGDKGWGYTGWNILAQDMAQQRTPANTLINLRIA
jgi:hypothetical protein